MSGGQGIMREFLNSVLIVVVLALVFGVILGTLQVGEQQRIQAEADTAARIAEADARARIAEADAEARVALAVIPAQEEKLFSFALLCGVGVVGMMVGMMGTVVLFNTRRRTSILEAMAVRFDTPEELHCVIEATKAIGEYPFLAVTKGGE